MKTRYNMNLKAVMFVLLTLVSLGINAQLDRSKMPKPGPEPEIKLEVPSEFKLKNGMEVLVVENHKLPRVSYSLRIDNNPIATKDKAGIESILGAMLGNGTTTISKDEFNEEIDFLGANLSFGFSGGFAGSLSKYSDRILELMADAAINPLLTEEEFEKEKTKLLESIKQEEKDVDAISRRVRNVLAYGKNHAYGEYVTEETINNVMFTDVLGFYEKYFNPNNAYLVVIGDVDVSKVQRQIEMHFGKWENSVDISIPLQPSAPNAQYTQINFVDNPNSTQSSIFVTNNVDLKMSDADYHAALITNNILGGGGEGYLFKNLREDKGYTYGAYSSLGASRYGLGRFNASAKVRNEVTDSAVVEFLKEIKRIKTEPVDAQLLKDSKAKYVGNFIMGLERPQTIANYALNIKLNDLPDDFYTTYLQKINDVSIEDVNRVANKYLGVNQRIVIVGKGSEVLENLEKTEIPILYYDKYANKTDKPNYDIDMPEGVTAKSILNKYLDATGVKSKMSTVKSIMTQYEATTPMGAVVSEEKRVDGKMVRNIYMGGNKMMSMVMTQDGATANKQALPENMSKDYKAEAGLFMEINLVDSDVIKLTGIEKVEGKDAYVISVTGEVVSYTLYYDVESGLKVKQVETATMGGQTQNQEAILKDYKEFNGIKFPETRDAIMMGQSVVFKLKEVKINEGVTDADFD